ncbi:AAA domain-containing protein [Cellulomonas sp. P24]|uniref:AAA domain-containing protein n=1 Tax=Cellulomonas sp. P24 TaxID=2885206 RepID=UPI00216B3EF2|nr:AAA domain-containing protein [Cellulomonas sp. P24]
MLRRFGASEHTVPSLGVVTLNAPQRTLVEQLLRDSGDDRVLQALDGGVDGDGLFVKNLENVQGDERDTILLSTAFSADGSGRLPLNFGPLNREGGERRLNVAVTRARREVVVFSSFDPADLRADETTSVGVKHLRDYLDLAAAGSAPHVGAAGTARVGSAPGGGPATATRTGAGATAASRRLATAVDRHREQIADGLRTRGLSVRTDVGLSEFRIDLVVSFPDEPSRSILAVLLDGPAWAARRTVADRDGLPVEVLVRSLRWPAVERVWLPEWLSSPGVVLDRLDEVARLIRSGHSSGPARPRVKRPDGEDFARSDQGFSGSRPS